MFEGWTLVSALSIGVEACLLLEIEERHRVCSLRPNLRPHFRFQVRLFGQVLIAAVCEPAEAIINLPIPWSFVFPLDFLHILDGVESEVYVKASTVLAVVHVEGSELAIVELLCCVHVW